MNDLEILKQIHEELKTVDHPRFTDNMIDFYAHLVECVPEDGFEQVLDDDQLSLEQETAVLQLQKYGYLDRKMKGIGRGRIEHHIDLRGKRFFELAEAQSKTTNETEIVETAENYPPPPWGFTRPDLMHDSGKRETFSTGAVRDTAEGKVRPDLISPFAVERLAEWLRLGSVKYSERNWERGLPVSRCIASLCRHLMKYQQGSRDEDNMAAIMCNAMFILHMEEGARRGFLPESLLDMPDYNAMPSCHKNGDEPYDT